MFASRGLKVNSYSKMLFWGTYFVTFLTIWDTLKGSHRVLLAVDIVIILLFP